MTPRDGAPETANMSDSIQSDSINVEAASYGDAVSQAADRLGVTPRDLAIEVLDPGRSANSLGGFRPVKVRAWRRDPEGQPDGARIPANAVRRQASAVGEEGHRGSRRGAVENYGPPPPPLDPSKITPELVETVRSIAQGIVEQMGFPCEVSAERTRDGIRAAVRAGERDQFLIGRDGETLAALQHLVARMLRARAPEDAIPRVEVDVAGYRDRRVESLRELARELIEEVRESGTEASTEPLSAIERRIIHLKVAEADAFTSVSVGDGLYKRVIIRRGDTKD
jgi:spoIIIJ-associated protein